MKLNFASRQQIKKLEIINRKRNVVLEEAKKRALKRHLDFILK